MNNVELKQKILLIESDIKAIVKPHIGEKYWINWYGAYDIAPKHLVSWVCVESDKLRNDLQNNANLSNELRAALVKNDYPESARKFVHIGYESQETVNRESAGNWYHHFK